MAKARHSHNGQFVLVKIRIHYRLSLSITRPVYFDQIFSVAQPLLRPILIASLVFEKQNVDKDMFGKVQIREHLSKAKHTLIRETGVCWKRY